METQVQTHRICKRCHDVKDITSFSKDATRVDGLHPHCKDCRRTYGTPARARARENVELKQRDNDTHKRYYARNRDRLIKNMPTRNPAYNKNSFLKSTYGITLAEFDALVEQQKGVCAICEKPETRKSRYGGTCRLHVDHDHNTGRVRGLLCHNCNSAIGHAKEDVNVLARSIIYLDKHKYE
jgi:hypothetical protein